MTLALDQHGINHMIVAISREMTPRGGKRHAYADTLFMGGLEPSEADKTELARFGLAKNYKIIFPSFDPAKVDLGPIGFHAVITDGLTQAVTLSNGRLWKRDRHSASILIFPDLHATVRLSSKGRLMIRDMKGQYHGHGYDLAREAVTAGASRKPGRIPVISSIGNMLTVIDMQTMVETFAVAA